jgi:hypothetical protein
MPWGHFSLADAGRVSSCSCVVLETVVLAVLIMIGLSIGLLADFWSSTACAWDSVSIWAIVGYGVVVADGIVFRLH